MQEQKDRAIKPRIIIHGGAGNISRSNLPREQWEEYKTSLLCIVRKTNSILDPPRNTDGKKPPGVDALTAAVAAVKELESDPLFNAGIGAVFNREGRIELEASVMVSSGHIGARKRAAGVSGIRHVRSPITLAAEVLKRGDESGGGGGQGHLQLNGEYVEGLARRWGLEMCDESLFWTKRRWDEHKRGLEREKRQKLGQIQENRDGPSCSWEAPHIEPDLTPDGKEWTWLPSEPGWDGQEYLPQGTVGCVALDQYGNIAVATSTGGLTNKLPGRLGDTPTVGAGFWAEEWEEEKKDANDHWLQSTISINSLIQREHETSTFAGLRLRTFPALRWQCARNLASLDPLGIIGKCFASCLNVPSYLCLSSNTLANEYQNPYSDEKKPLFYEYVEKPRSDLKKMRRRRAVAMSGTGNGDTFVKLSAARTTAALLRFSRIPDLTLDHAVTWMAGPGGELQRSAEDRWGKTGEGEGGIIGIELSGEKGKIVADFNRAMFRAWIDEEGKARCMVFRDEY